LYCARHVNGNANGWQPFDISPAGHPDDRVTAFDVTQDITTSLVNLAVAITASTSTDGHSDVYTIVGLNVNDANLDWTKLTWVTRTNNLGPKKVAALKLTQYSRVSNGVYPFAIAGTSETESTLASDYVITLDPSNAAPWSQDPLAKVATNVIQIAPGHYRLPFGFGVFTLFQDANYVNSGDQKRAGTNAGNSCAFNSFPTYGPGGTITDPGLLIVVLLDKIGGIAYSIAPLINNKGFENISCQSFSLKLNLAC
jgi:hypothetical protein